MIIYITIIYCQLKTTKPLKHYILLYLMKMRKHNLKTRISFKGFPSETNTLAVALVCHNKATRLGAKYLKYFTDYRNNL